MTDTNIITTPVNGKVTKQAEITWYAGFNQRIEANADLGTVPSNAAYKVALLLGAPGRPKRPGVEALFVAMTLRPNGTTIGQFMNAGQCRTANNWLAFISDNLPRSIYGLVTVTKGPQGHRVSRLTPKGVAHCKAAGMSEASLSAFVKPPKGPSKPKGTAKATASASKPKSAKPTTDLPKATEGNAVLAKALTEAKAHPVLTNDGPKVVEPVS